MAKTAIGGRTAALRASDDRLLVRGFLLPSAAFCGGRILVRFLSFLKLASASSS